MKSPALVLITLFFLGAGFLTGGAVQVAQLKQLAPMTVASDSDGKQLVRELLAMSLRELSGLDI